jgi:hypothetical protein
MFWVLLFTYLFYGSNFRTKALIVELTHKNIRTVGDLSRLDEASINRLPLASPKISHAKAVLQVSRNWNFLYLHLKSVVVCDEFIIM